MPEERKNIDKLFKDFLLGYKISVPQGAWNRLHDVLQNNRRIRRFRYIKLAAASVLVIIAFSSGYFISEYRKDVINTGITEITHHEKTSETSEVKNPFYQNNIEDKDTESETLLNLQDKNLTAGLIQSENLDEKKKSEKPSQIQKEATADISKSQDVKEIPALTDSEIQEKPKLKETVTFDDKTLADKPPLVEVEVQPAKETVAGNEQLNEHNIVESDVLLELLKQDEAKLAGKIPGMSKKNNTLKTWSVGAQLSPVYSYRTLDGSGISSNDEEIPKEYFNEVEGSILTLAGGLSIDYRVSNKFSIASGLYFSRIGQENNDVIAFNDPDSKYLYKLSTSGGAVSINPEKFERVMIRQIASPKDSIAGDYLVNGTFVQNYDYLEVPLMVKYRLVNKKFGINLMGGLSPGILINNRSYFKVDGEKLQTGITEDINNMIFNSVVGIGLEYSISSKLSISMDPVFKYSLSPINPGSNLKYRPYSFSWFTGLSYKL